MGVIAKVRFEYYLQNQADRLRYYFFLGRPSCQRYLLVGFIKVGNHETSSGLELVRSGFFLASAMSNHLRLIPGSPCSSPPGVILPGRDLILSYAATRTSRSAKIYVGPANLPLPDGGWFQQLS
uniref:Uncharacterized protein n=1 Tax=Phlegmariurus squarrosus TaxID=73615 RepID=H9M8C2_PHLSQ|nr:hypothetical protein HusqMp67 [Phlegmariurus squarrosus]AEV55829.1 hypothetical protein HusqMp67 [Phlegmariurus squarrosus]